MTELAAIPAITVLCYLFAELYKSFAPPEKNKHIPALCAALGLVLGIVCYILIPGWIPAENPVVAAAIGAVSGWAATGVNQTYKQEKQSKSGPLN